MVSGKLQSEAHRCFPDNRRQVGWRIPSVRKVWPPSLSGVPRGSSRALWCTDARQPVPRKGVGHSSFFVSVRNLVSNADQTVRPIGLFAVRNRPRNVRVGAKMLCHAVMRKFGVPFLDGFENGAMSLLRLGPDLF